MDLLGAITQVLAEIASATADPTRIDAKTAGSLMAAANHRKKKTKKDFLEAFAVVGESLGPAGKD